MKNSDIADPLFLEAVEYLDAGNVTALEQLLNKHAYLVRERITLPEKGYFEHPYLLWFIAGNPIRHEKLPVNIVEITYLILGFVKKESPETFQQQIEYALGLVATGRIPRESGVQIELMDLLINAGSTPGSAHGALAHGNISAAEHLVKRGGKLTLLTAIVLNRKEDIKQLLATASIVDKQNALTAAAFYGKAEMITLLIEPGMDLNAYPQNASGFHSHATALHQAVYSGSLDAVKILVEAGASLQATDLIYGGTPLGWAEHMQTDPPNEAARKKYALIEEYLNSLANIKS